MSNLSASRDASIDVIAPDSARERVVVTQLPFLIGRGEAGNHLPLPDPRVSRLCAALVEEAGEFWIEDRGHRLGVFVNGKKIDRKPLEDRDVISFGLEDSYTLVFRITDRVSPSLQTLMTRMESVAESYATSGGLSKLKLLLEATMLLHSQLPLDSVLEAMMDRAITVTGADRGMLLEAAADGGLRQRLAREKGAQPLSPNSTLSPSQTAIGMAVEQQNSVITEDLHLAPGVLQAAQSIVMQRLRAVVAIPLYAMPRANTEASLIHIQRGKFLGVLYLDSQRPAAFSALDRQILDAIAVESASILDNARLVEHERERQRIERELGIARQIQQALLPKEFHHSPHLAISGANVPCTEVGGDYFDVFPIDAQRTAFVIADVSGKGLGAALLTPMLQGALSAMSLDVPPERAFRHVNTFLCSHAEVGRYATAFFGILDREGNLEYVNAGHPSPLLIGRDGITELYTAGSFPVGLIPEAQHAIAHAKLEPGDTLVLFSDGVTEAADVSDEFFGVPRLIETLATHYESPLDEAKAAVITAVEQFSAGAEQADDLTLLLVRYTGSAEDTKAAPLGAVIEFLRDEA
jgi:sigma-B regulation protein RsbU (phosphoserine phosphatase)